MKIYSETGYLIIMDPAYLKAADRDAIRKIDFLRQPKDAAKLFEQHLFPDAFGGLIGLVKLSDGEGVYEIDLSQVDFWDVDSKSKKIIFGVDLGSFILFDVKHIQSLVQHFDPIQFDNSADQKEYFARLFQKFSDRDDLMIWSRSPLPFAEGWHEINITAFKKID
ncbi:hypothetical protein L0Z72_14480 [candidate division KSB1 bacterium]|nr:hypothetical protein [candidate division KSB1 bacterium]